MKVVAAYLAAAMFDPSLAEEPPRRRTASGPTRGVVATEMASLMSLRQNGDHAATRGRSLKKGKKHQTRECFIVAVAKSRAPVTKGDGYLLSTADEEEEFECELDPIDSPDGATAGLTVPLEISSAQTAQLHRDLNSGKVTSNVDSYFDPEATIDEYGVHVPPAGPMRIKKQSNRNGDKEGSRDGGSSPSSGERRALAVATMGDKPILAVRVVDSTGKAHSHDAATMSDNIFGTNADPVNLKNQLAACSHGQLNVINDYSEDISHHEEAKGVIEVTIPIELVGNTRGTIRNAVTTAVQAKLGFNLPGPFQHVMYMLEECYKSEDEECGWAAYAYVNSWNSVYRGRYYYMSGLQMHELGHNFNLAHSGGLNGLTYTDHTCLMGNPLYSDDVGKMCFNPAKNWQLDWYDDAKEEFVPSANTPNLRRTLVGIADYGDENRNGRPVVIKLETGTDDDYFVGLNRAAGVNADNDEADNEVTIIESGNNGEGYSQSFLKAHLVQGESYTVSTNWQNTGRDLKITAEIIDTNASPGYAEIDITLLCTSDSHCDEDSFCNIDGGGTCVATTEAPTEEPTSDPVTAAPSATPTASPTPSCSLPTSSSYLVLSTDGCTDIMDTTRAVRESDMLYIVFREDRAAHDNLKKIEMEFKADCDADRKTKWRIEQTAFFRTQDPGSWPYAFVDDQGVVTYRLSVPVGDIGGIGGTEQAGNRPVVAGEQICWKIKVEDNTGYKKQIEGKTPNSDTIVVDEAAEDPTRQPSSLPTSAPSPRPSAFPTSASPTRFPSEDPSKAPSDSPTTLSPTMSTMPSSSPSKRPSSWPSSAPSFPPTGNPSSFPSAGPSASPSATPSSSPTISLMPSSSPSESPSWKPSSSPSASPSAAPSKNPTASPVSSCSLPTSSSYLVISTDGCTDIMDDTRAVRENDMLYIVFREDRAEHDNLKKIEMEFKADCDTDRKTKWRIEKTTTFFRTEDPGSWPYAFVDDQGVVTYRLSVPVSDIGGIGGTEPSDDRPVVAGEQICWKVKVEDDTGYKKQIEGKTLNSDTIIVVEEAALTPKFNQ